MTEQWRPIPDFEDYDISDHGRIYNLRTHQPMRISQTNHGHAKISLVDNYGDRHTRSVALLVAEAFCEPPNLRCDQVVVLDGDLSNLHASNLVWRPARFAWKYTRQLKEAQPNHFHNLEVENVVNGYSYPSIYIAGIKEGLLFQDIWESTYKGKPCFPTGSVFEVVQRV